MLWCQLIRFLQAWTRWIGFAANVLVRLHSKTSPHILVRGCRLSFLFLCTSCDPPVTSQRRWYSCFCNSLIRSCDSFPRISENATRSVRHLLSCHTPLSSSPRLPFAHWLSLVPPALHSFHLLWATLCIKSGISVMYECIQSTLWNPPPSPLTTTTLQFRQAWSTQELLVRPPLEDTWCLKPSAWVWKTSSLGGREAGRLVESQEGNKPGRSRDLFIFSICFISEFFLLAFYCSDSFRFSHNELGQISSGHLRPDGHLFETTDCNHPSGKFDLTGSVRCTISSKTETEVLYIHLLNDLPNHSVLPSCHQHLRWLKLWPARMLWRRWVL